MTENQERLLELIKKKKEFDKRAQEIVFKLIEPSVEKAYLLENALHIGPAHFEDVIEERRLAGICGWTLCQNSLDPKMQSKKQQYIIRGKRVLDITLRKSFCSSKCFAKSTHFKKQLLVSPLWLRDEYDETEAVVFEILEEDTELHGLQVDITKLALDDEVESSSSDLEPNESCSASATDSKHSI